MLSIFACVYWSSVCILWRVATLGLQPIFDWDVYFLILNSMLLFRHSVMSNFLRLHGLQHTRLPCPSPSPKFDQTHVHGVSDAMQPSLSPFPAFNHSQNQSLFNESVLCIRWPQYCSFSFSISPSNEYSGLISFRVDWFDLLVVQGTLKSLLQHHSSKASIL